MQNSTPAGVVVRGIKLLCWLLHSSAVFFGIFSRNLVSLFLIFHPGRDLFIFSKNTQNHLKGFSGFSYRFSDGLFRLSKSNIFLKQR